LIQKAKISFSANTQETFGIGTVEALFLGAVPLVPNRLAYKELYSDIFKYNSHDEMKEKIKFFMKNFDSEEVQTSIKKNKEYIEKLCLGSINEMAQVIKNE